MEIKMVLLILTIHWVADFVLQTDKEAKNKSTDWYYLLAHTYKYSLIWMIASYFILINYLGWFEALGACYGFFMITFICHTLTDAITSRINSKLWAKGQVHNFFVSIGFDQLLHYIQLFYTFKFMIE